MAWPIDDGAGSELVQLQPLVAIDPIDPPASPPLLAADKVTQLFPSTVRVIGGPPYGVYFRMRGEGSVGRLCLGVAELVDVRPAAGPLAEAGRL